MNPKHIAIIPDGNGRWAKQRGESRISGHIRGTAVVKDTIIQAKQLGIPILTFYAFSDENWKRPQDEIQGLMMLLKEYLISERATLVREKIQLRALGEISKLPPFVLEELQKTIEMTSSFNQMILNFAISYGGRSEIVRAAKLLAKACMAGDVKPDDISEKSFQKHLYTADLPDPDLLIRTSGEMRISNFLLWQMSYTEIYAPEVLWPDFNTNEFLKALEVFRLRKRRFGLTDEQYES
ncbi:MAG: di-trans,poly-cis-decaprenylcistransferase [Deltaproteobacteria bacterium]|nr:di-trans,poly-cis-decaprenylcistransferase [Deltaproteobacteria bacterium]